MANLADLAVDLEAALQLALIELPERPGERPPVHGRVRRLVILRAIPNKLLGVMALAASILILAFLPWLETSRVRSARYRPLYRQFFWVFVIVCIGLGWLGGKPPEGNYVLFARIFTVYYFAFFLVILPVLGKIEKTKSLPNSISESVLREGAPIGAPAPPPAGAKV